MDLSVSFHHDFPINYDNGTKRTLSICSDRQA